MDMNIILLTIVVTASLVFPLTFISVVSFKNKEWRAKIEPQLRNSHLYNNFAALTRRQVINYRRAVHCALDGYMLLLGAYRECKEADESNVRSFEETARQLAKFLDIDPDGDMKSTEYLAADEHILDVHREWGESIEKSYRDLIGVPFPKTEETDGGEKEEKRWP